MDNELVAPTGAPGAATVEVPNTAAAPPRTDWTAAFAAARETVAAQNAAGGRIPFEAGASALPDGETAGEGAEDGSSVEGDAEGELSAEEQALVVELGSLEEGAEPLRLMADDEATATHLRTITERAAQVGRAEEMVAQADAYRQQAEEQFYVMRADPVGFMTSHMQTPADQIHMARTLITKPAVFGAIKDWVVALADNPEALPHEAELVEAQNIRRREEVSQSIAAEREQAQNARTVMQSVRKSIDSIVPADWDSTRRTAMLQDVTRDLIEMAQRENLRTMDPRKVPGIVQHRLSLYGLQPRSASAKAPSKEPAAPKAPSRTQPTGQQLVAAADARKRAAGAGPGVGSPTAAVPKPPPGTLLTSKNGKPSVFDHIRANIGRLRKAP